jgi:RNA polymerase sigma-70 factor (ECF subfamily)
VSVRTVKEPTGDLGSRRVEERLEQHRVELTGYCYRMLGASSEAEDAVQETLTRAWRNIDRFESRSTLRTWLYRNATNVCFDFTGASQRRAVPMDFGGPGEVDAPLAPPLPETTWIAPAADELIISPTGDPAQLAEARASVRLAFIAALQHLPPRQRAVLILRDVLRWRASEVAELLDLSVAAVNSALQRARATLASKDLEVLELSDESVDAANRELLARYVDAFERYDIDELTTLLHEDASQSMPPYPLWLAGRETMARWMLGPGAPCRGSRLVPLKVNGAPGFAQYRDGGATPWSIQVLDIRAGRIAEITYFLETDGSLFESFGLPAQLPAPAQA